jgi:lipopolysaccharide heptosyltransferase II
MRRPRPTGHEKIKRILLIKLHGIGNILLLQPAIQLIRDHFPQAKMEFLTFDTNAGILSCIEGLDDCLYINRQGIMPLLRSVWTMFSTIGQKRYDLVVDFEQFAHLSVLLAAVSKAPNRIGFKNPSSLRHRFLTKAIPYSDTAHMSDIFLRLAWAAGVPRQSAPHVSLNLSENHLEEAIAFERTWGISTEDVMILLHPGSSANLVIRRWPPGSFAALADRLARELGGILVFGGDTRERDLIDEIRSEMSSSAINAAGLFSVGGFSALCSRANLVVSNDTATVHIASALERPVVGIYGPNTPFLYGPWGSARHTVLYRHLPCSPCLTNFNHKLSNCQTPLCMDTITVDDVFFHIRARYFDLWGKIYPEYCLVRSPLPQQMDADFPYVEGTG